MRASIVRLLVAIALLCGASAAFAKLNGPPRGVTGAPAFAGKPAEPNCQYCHDPAHPLNDPSGKLEILDLPPQFDLDTDYSIRVRLSHDWNPLPNHPLNWGFQLTATRSDSGTGYGNLVPGTGTQIATTAGGAPGDPSRQYIEHNSSGNHHGDSSPVEWTFTWHSPSYPAAMVYFFAAGNSANGDSLSSNDYIFTARDSVPFVNAGVTELIRSSAELVRPWPNPTRGRAEIRYAIVKPGTVDLAVYDITGRRMRTLLHGSRPAGVGSASWDGRDEAGARLMNGLYFVRLAAPGAMPRVQKVVLSR